MDESYLPENATGTFTKEPQKIVNYCKAEPLSLVNDSFEDSVISSSNLSPKLGFTLNEIADYYGISVSYLNS